MAYSYIQYTGNGTQQTFTFPFSYIAVEDITPSVNGVSAVAYDLSNYLGIKTSAPTLDNSGNPLVSGALYYNSVSASMWLYNVSAWVPLGSAYVYSFTGSNTIQIVPAPASGSVVNIRRITQKATPIVNFTDGSVLQSSDLDLLAQFSLYSAQESADEAGAAANAGVSATAAAVSETNAAASAATATTQAGIASTNATTATTQASNAAASATAAASSATSAASSAATSTTNAAATAADRIAVDAQAAAALALVNNGSVSVIASDLGGMGFAYDLGSVAEAGSGVSNSAPGHIVTVANNISSVNSVAANITAVTNAVSSASSASTSATNAASSATSAAASASTATTQAGIATTQATNAASSATSTAALLASFRSAFLGSFASDSAAVSFASANSITLSNGIMYENNSTTPEKFRIYNGTTWQDYDSSAQASQSAAALSATNAATSASTATTQASAASTSATNAATSATAAAGSATTATTQASAAATSASNAATSATNAANSATAAAASAAAAASGGLKIINNLSDLASVPTARTNLGLGTAATTAATDYATAAQGTLAGTALQPAAIGTTVQGYDADLQAIGAISGTTGLLKKTAANTWSLDTTAYGTITSVAGTAPIVSSGGTAPTISMAAATGSVPGYLTAADWTTFNNKQAALGFTPYNATNPNNYVSQAGITALPLSQLASILDMGTVP